MSFDLFVLVNDVPADLMGRWVHALAENGFSVTGPAGVDLVTHSGSLPFRIEQVPAWFARPDLPPLPAPCTAGFGWRVGDNDVWDDPDADGHPYRLVACLDTPSFGSPADLTLQSLCAAFLAHAASGLYVDPQAGQSWPDWLATEAAMNAISRHHSLRDATVAAPRSGRAQEDGPILSAPLLQSLAEVLGRRALPQEEVERLVTAVATTNHPDDVAALLTARPVEHAAQFTDDGDQLTDGPLDPHDILKIYGSARALELLRDRLTRLCGLDLQDAERVARPMVEGVEIIASGDGILLPGMRCAVQRFQAENEHLAQCGGRPSVGRRTYLGYPELARV